VPVFWRRFFVWTAKEVGKVLRESRSDTVGAILATLILSTATWLGERLLQLWRGDRGSVTLVTAAIAYAALVVGTRWLSIGVRLSMLTGPPTEVPRFPTLRGTARSLLVAEIIVLPLALGVLFYRDRLLRQNTVVLVADLHGPERERYQVTEELLAQLRGSLTKYPDVTIIASGDVITEQQGAGVARDRGKRYKADLVVWGRYATTGSDVRLTVHLEVLDPAHRHSQGDEAYVTQAPLAELDKFRFQDRFSREMSAFILFLTAIVRYEGGAHEDCIDRLNRAIALERWPQALADQGEVYMHRGNAQYRLSRLSEAEADFSKALEIDPHLAGARVNRGNVYSDEGRYADAIRDFTTALESSPQRRVAFTNRGNAYFKLGSFDLAIADYSRAIEIEPSHPYAYNGRGNAYLKNGEPVRAISDFAAVIRIAPRFAPGYANRGNAHEAAGNPEEALRDFERALQLDPKIAGAHFNRGNVYSRMGSFDLALIEYSKAIRVDPAFGVAYAARCTVNMKLNRPQDALEDCTQATALDASVAKYHLLRCSALMALRRKEPAVQDCRQAASLSDDPALRKSAEEALRLLEMPGW